MANLSCGYPKDGNLKASKDCEPLFQITYFEPCPSSSLMNSKDKKQSENKQWPETQWSIVLDAGDESGEKRRIAIERLLVAYWPALQAHLVIRKRLDHAAAEDFLQDFFLKKFVEQNIVERADYSRGKFRSFILKALENFLRDYYRSPAFRNLPVQIPEDMPDQDFTRPSADVFDKAWALRVFYHANELFKKFCEQNNREDQWAIYRERVLRPVFFGEAPRSYEALADGFDGLNAKQLRNLLTKAKGSFSKSLRVVVRDYVEDESFVEEEIDQLLGVLKDANNLDEAVAPFLEESTFFENNKESQLNSQYASVVFQEQAEPIGEDKGQQNDPLVGRPLATSANLKSAWTELLNSTVGSMLSDSDIAKANFDTDASLRDLLFAISPSIGTINFLRKFAKQKHSVAEDASLPLFLGLYILCISVGIYKCDQLLSKLDPENLDRNFAIVGKYKWLDSSSREYLSIARKMI